MYFVYILRSIKNGRYYKGSTDDLQARLLQHNAGESKFTSRDKPWELAWSTTVPTRDAALKLERKLKNITSRARIEEFIRKYKHAVSGNT